MPSTALTSHSSFLQVLSLVYTPKPLLCSLSLSTAKASRAVSKEATRDLVTLFHKCMEKKPK